jgi:hypothetical protein
MFLSVTDQHDDTRRRTLSADVLGGKLEHMGNGRIAMCLDGACALEHGGPVAPQGVKPDQQFCVRAILPLRGRLMAIGAKR